MTRFHPAHLTDSGRLRAACVRSAGRSRGAGSRHGDSWVSGITVGAVGPEGTMQVKNYLAEQQHALLPRPRGMASAHPGAALGGRVGPPDAPGG